MFPKGGITELRFAIAAGETVCFFFMLIVLAGTLYKISAAKLRTKLFTALVIIEMAELLLDTSCWMLEEHTGVDGLLRIVNTLSLLPAPMMAGLFVYYIVALINEKEKTPYTIAHILAAFNTAGILFTIIFTIKGYFFKIDNGHYIPGIWNGLTGFSAGITVLFLAIYVFIKWKQIGLHDTLAIYIYLTPPLLLCLVAPEKTNGSLAIVAMSIAILAVYIMLQARETNEAMLREKLLQEFSYIDSLTGIPNRRAYDQTLNHMDAGKTVGVIFCDSNRLKYINDNFGHKMGDAMLLNFVAHALECFGKDTLYRISGDEFVIIYPVETRAIFQSEYDRFCQHLNAASLSFATGSEWGLGRDITNLISRAEKEMYRDKAAYYKATKYERRKNS